MKFSLSVFLLFFLAATTSGLLAQKSSDDNIQLTAVRLNADIVDAFVTTARCAAYKVDDKGILRPQKGYHMYYKKAKGIIVIKPESHPETEAFIAGKFEEVELPGGLGTVSCYCEQGSEDCFFQLTNEHGEGRDDYQCTGTCGCGLGIILNPGNVIRQYETAGGEWFNF